MTSKGILADDVLPDAGHISSLRTIRRVFLCPENQRLRASCILYIDGRKDISIFEKWRISKKAEKHIKAFAAKGLLDEYGFTVPLSKVKVIESYSLSGTPKYVRFGVGGYVYGYDGEAVEQISKGRRRKSVQGGADS